MLLSKDLIGIYDFLLDIMVFTVVSTLCVHVSLWTYIFMIDVYLETYTHESSYIFNWYFNSLVTTLFITFDSLGVSKRHKLCFSFGFRFGP